MTKADVLAVSNSTFSFTAAMLNAQTSAATERFVRPVPEARGLRPFDPWDSSPLLRVESGAACDELYAGRGAYG